MKKLFLSLFIFSFIFANGQNTWTAKTNLMGVARMGGVGFSIGPKGYFGTGNDWWSVHYDDFWEYDPVSDSWTQMASFPGAPRMRAVGLSTDTKGYILAGQQSSNYYGDVWEYDPVLNNWTAKTSWNVQRISPTGFTVGNKIYMGTGYGPGAVFTKDFWEFDPAANSWVQKADFGGNPKAFAVGFCIGDKGYMGSGSEVIAQGTSDFWEYDTTLNSWTAKASLPGNTRCEAVGFAIGDYGFVGTGTNSWGSGSMADFWKFDPALNFWTSIAAFPGGVREHASCFAIGCRGYVVAGFENDNQATLKNDLWEYLPANTCLPPVALFIAVQNPICPGTCTDFTNLSTNANSYEWHFPGASTPLSTDIHPVNICYNTPGSYDVTLIAFNPVSSDTVTFPNYIMVYPYSPSQSIFQYGDTLLSNTGFVTYQWFYDGDTIAGATNYFYIATQGGDYSVVCFDNNGCSVEAVILNVTTDLKPVIVGHQPMLLYPNPAGEFVIVELADEFKSTGREIIIYNIYNEKMMEVQGQAMRNKFRIDVSLLASGIYYLEICGGEKTMRNLFVK